MTMLTLFIKTLLLQNSCVTIKHIQLSDVNDLFVSNYGLTQQCSPILQVEQFMRAACDFLYLVLYAGIKVIKQSCYFLRMVIQCINIDKILVRYNCAHSYTGNNVC